MPHIFLQNTFLYIVVLCASLFMVQSASAQQAQKGNQITASSQPSVTTASYENWTLRCVMLTDQDLVPQGRSCEVVQTIQLQGQQQPIAQLAIGRLPNDKDLTVTAVLPNNISFPSTVTIQKDASDTKAKDGKTQLEWRRCLPNGCYADTKPNTTFLTQIDPMLDGSLTFTDASNRPLSIPVSWKGLSQAMTALEQK